MVPNGRGGTLAFLDTKNKGIPRQLACCSTFTPKNQPNVGKYTIHGSHGFLHTNKRKATNSSFVTRIVVFGLDENLSRSYLVFLKCYGTKFPTFAGSTMVRRLSGDLLSDDNL